MTIIPTLLLRELTLAEAQVSELTGPLARRAQHHIHEALRNVETIHRLQNRQCTLGDRPDPADEETREGVAW